MRKAALFDAGDTLLHWNVHKRERFAWLCERAGVALPEDPELRLRAARAAERFFYSEFTRPDSWSEAWWIEQTAAGLAAVGLPAELAKQVVGIRRSLDNTFALDPDAMPVLAELRQRGYKIGLVSNWDGTLAATCDAVGLTPYVDYVGDSSVFGQAKPSPEFFLHVLKQLDVPPATAFHVGDHYDADVEGARAAGITPILIDPLGCEDRVCEHRASGLRDVLEICETILERRFADHGRRP